MPVTVIRVAGERGRRSRGAAVGHRGRRKNAAHVIEKTGAQTRNLQVRAAARRIRRLRTEVGVEVFVVCLEQAKAEVTTEERQRVIQTAANCQSGPYV